MTSGPAPSSISVSQTPPSQDRNTETDSSPAASAREADDEPFSDLEVSDAADESDDDGDGDRMVDIRALVGKGKRAKGGEQSVSPPPAKKLR